MRVLTDLRDLTLEAVLDNERLASVEHHERDAQVELIAEHHEVPAIPLAVLRRLQDRLMRAKRYTDANRVQLAIDERHVRFDEADQHLSDSLVCDDIARDNEAARYSERLDGDSRIHAPHDDPKPSRIRSAFEIPQGVADPKSEDSGFPEWVRRAYFLDAKRAERLGDEAWADDANMRRMPKSESDEHHIALDTLDVLRDEVQPDRYTSDVPLSTTLQFPAHVDGAAFAGSAQLSYFHRSVRASDAAVEEGAVRRGRALSAGPAAEEQAGEEIPRLHRREVRWVSGPTLGCARAPLAPGFKPPVVSEPRYYTSRELLDKPSADRRGLPNHSIKAWPGHEWEIDGTSVFPTEQVRVTFHPQWKRNATSSRIERIRKARIARRKQRHVIVAKRGRPRYTTPRAQRRARIRLAVMRREIAYSWTGTGLRKLRPVLVTQEEREYARAINEMAPSPAPADDALTWDDLDHVFSEVVVA